MGLTGKIDAFCDILISWILKPKVAASLFAIQFIAVVSSTDSLWRVPGIVFLCILAAYIGAIAADRWDGNKQQWRHTCSRQIKR